MKRRIVALEDVSGESQVWIAVRWWRGRALYQVRTRMWGEPKNKKQSSFPPLLLQCAQGEGASVIKRTHTHAHTGIRIILKKNRNNN
jgi:hypothetical protein